MCISEKSKKLHFFCLGFSKGIAPIFLMMRALKLIFHPIRFYKSLPFVDAYEVRTYLLASVP